MNKFQLFLGKLKTPENALLIESISTGYKIYIEAFEDSESDTLLDEYLFRFYGNSDENPWKYVIDNPQSEGVTLLKQWIDSVVNDPNPEIMKQKIETFREILVGKIVNPVSDFSEEDEIAFLNKGNEALTMAPDIDDHLVLQYAINLIDSPKFINALKNPQLKVNDFIQVANQVVSDSIGTEFKNINEAYEDVYTNEDDRPSYSAYSSEGSSEGSYKYVEPLDIYADSSEGYTRFKVHSDDGDLLHDTDDITDAHKFIQETGNKVGHVPKQSYGNRWLNKGDKYTIEDLVYLMDKNGGSRKPLGLLNVSDEEIERARQRIKM